MDKYGMNQGLGFRSIVITAILSIYFLSCGSESLESTPEPTKDTTATSTTLADVDQGTKTEIDKKVDALLAKMTLEEKVGQMTQITINSFFEGEFYKPKKPVKLDPKLIQKFLVDLKTGSIFGCPRFPLTRQQWREFITILQNKSIETTDIPLIYGIDAIHGVNFTLGSTIFPQQIGLAATWNTELVEKTGEICAYETKASFAHWNFSPVLGLGRQPLWSRFFETFGEDVYLTTKMGEAIISGYEGKDVANDEKVAACMKHYLGYSVPLSGKDRTQVWIPDRQLREYFLPPFRAAVNAGVHTVMINSGEINGIPVHASKYLLTDLLRGELGFKGIAVTDFKDIILLHENHKIASSYKGAIKLSINAGMDMSMVPFDTDFTKHLIELVNEGEVPMTRIDESTRRILTVKHQLGLFEKPLPDFDHYKKFGSDEFKKTAVQAALESITLLKNDKNILPLETGKQVLVTGATSNSMIYLNGPWTYTWQGSNPEFDQEDKNTVFEAIKLVNENSSNEKGVEIDKELDIAKAVAAAKKADVIVACVGETPGVEEKGNTNSLVLNPAQVKLVKELSKTGKPIVLVLNSGRPLIITEIADLASAIIMAYYPGNEGGDALAKLLYGEENFSGKLPYTYPKYAGSISTYDHKNTDHNIEGVLKGYNPLFEFGFGLSYTTIEYKDLSINSDKLKPNDDFQVEVKVQNTGKIAIKETVQLYIADNYASITPPAKRLRSFTKVALEPGETKRVKFDLTTKDLEFVGIDNKWILEPGTFTVEIGGLKKEFEITR